MFLLPSQARLKPYGFSGPGNRGAPLVVGPLLAAGQLLGSVAQSRRWADTDTCLGRLDEQAFEVVISDWQLGPRRASETFPSSA